MIVGVGVDVGVVFVVLAGGVVCDVVFLRSKVVSISDAVFVMTGVPDFA